MSARTDCERAEERRHQAIQRGKGIHYKLGRILDMYEDGFTDAEIGEALGWHKRTVMRYRQVLQLVRGVGGRWRDAA